METTLAKTVVPGAGLLFSRYARMAAVNITGIAFCPLPSNTIFNVPLFDPLHRWLLLLFLFFVLSGETYEHVSFSILLEEIPWSLVLRRQHFSLLNGLSITEEIVNSILNLTICM